MNLLDERTIALAAILQACSSVQSLARSGACIEREELALLKSISVLDAVNTPSVYGGLSELSSGLETIATGALVNTASQHLEVLNYANGLLRLQANLYRDQHTFAEFAQEVERLSGVSEDDFVTACSELYQRFISPLSPRIIVQGEEVHLQTDGVPDRIRGMLLAGIRSAVLWQQKGGNRFRLIWERTRMQNAAKSLSANV